MKWLILMKIKIEQYNAILFICIIFLSSAICLKAQQPPSPVPKKFRAECRYPFASTGYYVKKGESVNVKVTGGTWCLAVNGAGWKNHPSGKKSRSDFIIGPEGLNDVMMKWVKDSRLDALKFNKITQATFDSYDYYAKWGLVAKIGNKSPRMHIKNVGQDYTITATADGMLTFGHYDPVSRDNTGEFNLEVTLPLPGLIIPIPGIPTTGIPGQQTTIPPNQTQGGIDGLPIVEEDTDNTWYGLGQTIVTIAPGSRVSYTFEHGDKFSSKPYTDSFNPFTVPNVSKRIKGPHKYTENGLYNITLTVRFTRRDTNPDGTFTDVPTVMVTNPFPVIVVDHRPDYIGNALIMINGPGNATSLPFPSKKKTDFVYEDSTETFTVIGLFKFFAELPPGTDTGISPDRFGGVDPLTVKYKIDYGDGTPVTDWKPWQEVQKVRPKNIQDPINQDEFESIPFKHRWPEPGEYTMKVTLSYQEVEYTDIKFNGTSYSFKKKQTPDKFGTRKQKIVVVDRTPPRLEVTELVDITATTGDEIEFCFEAEDNSNQKELMSAEVHIEKWDAPGSFLKKDLMISQIGPSAIRGKRYQLKCKWRAPDNFAHKPTTTQTPLKYYLILTDGEGNVNEGRVSIFEDNPPRYGENISGIAYGNLNIVDNDPPSISFSIYQDNKEILSIEAKETIRDNCSGSVCSPGDIVCCDNLVGSCQQITDPESNPAPLNINAVGIKVPTAKIEIPEDRRYRIIVETKDNVDGVAKEIRFLISGGTLKKIKAGEYRGHEMFTQPGNITFSIIAFDAMNIAGNSCRRKVDISAKIVSHSFSAQTLHKD